MSKLTPIKCMVCDKIFTPKDKRRKTCSRSCGGKLGSTQIARDKAMITKTERYGDPHYNNRDKAVKTVQDTYGDEYTNASQVPEVKARAVETYIERHGGMGMASESVASKVLKSTKDGLGIQDSTITNVGQIESIKDKIKKTSEDKWGGIGFASEELSKRSEATFRERYGDDLYSGEYRVAQVQRSLMDKYGVNSPMLIPETIDKVIETHIRNHGGMGNGRDSIKKELLDKMELFENLYNSGLYSFSEIEDILERSEGTLRSWAKELNMNISKPNKLNESWQHFIKEKTGVHFDFEGKIYGDNRKADLYNEDLKIAIEINPTITHSTQPTVFHGKRVPVRYHQERSIAAEEGGWHLIHVFDWDCPDDIVSLIKAVAGVNQTRVYARKCEIREIEVSEADKLISEHHRQGSRARATIAYGLFFEDELVQAMTFSRERFVKSNDGDYELLRLASKDGLRIIGGASRLLKAFIVSNHQPSRIKSFVDYSKGYGGTYIHMGMRFIGFAGLNAYYANIDTGEAYKVTRVSQLFKKEYEREGLSQQEYMNKKRFYRINDSGNKIFEWRKAQEL